MNVVKMFCGNVYSRNIPETGILDICKSVNKLDTSITNHFIYKDHTI